MVEALGGWHEDVAALIIKLARKLTSHPGKEADESIKYLFQRRLRIPLMCGNSSLILNRT